MRNWRVTALAAGAIAVTMVAAGSFSVAESTGEGLIKYRKALMGANGGHMGALAGIVRGEAEHGADDVLVHATAINAIAGLLPDAFMENAEGAETRALPAIWENWDDFAAKAAALEEASAALMEAAEGGDMEAIGAAFGPVGASCGGCHETYRAQ